MNFNQSPYFDDYSEDDHYYKVLFKTGTPVQTRELNNLQSMMQSQIRRFGDHIFNVGARVSGARFGDLMFPYVLIEGTSPWTNLPVNLHNIPNEVKIRGTATQLLATVTHRSTPHALNDNNFMLFLVYHGTAIDGETRSFLPGETLEVLNDDGEVVYTVAVKCNECDESATDIRPSTGFGSIFFIEEGVFYINGMFIPVEKQKFVISPFVPVSRLPTVFTVGLNVEETIELSDNNMSLADGSLGYPNISSPGADRYKVKLKLHWLAAREWAPGKFIKLVKYMYGRRSFVKADSEYSLIEDELARRTYEESGNYSVRPFEVRFIQEKAQSPGDPKGFDPDGSDDNMVAIVGPHTCYIKGRRHESHQEKYVVSPKARDTSKIATHVLQVPEHAYILMTPYAGTSVYANSPTSHSVADGTIVEAYSGAVNETSMLPTGQKIGTFRVLDAKYDSGVVGTDAVYKYYIYDVSFTDGNTFADVNSVFQPTHKFLATIVSPSVVNKNNSSLIYKIDKDEIKTLRDYQNPDKGSITFHRKIKLYGKTNSSGVATFSAPTGQYFPAVTRQNTVFSIEGADGIMRSIPLEGTTNRSTTNAISIDFGLGYAGRNVVIITESVASKTIERTKRLMTTSDVIGTIEIDIPMLLTKADVQSIKRIVGYVKGNIQDTGTHIEMPLDIFTVDNGQRDHYYSNGAVALLAGAIMPGGVHEKRNDYGLIVEYDYFEHSRSDGVLTVDSYADAIGSGSLTYSTIPAYKDSTGTQFRLSKCFDFRPLMMNGSIGRSTIPSFDELVFFDVEHYLPRIDVIQIDDKGIIDVLRGVSSASPKPPTVNESKMALFEVWMPAYVHDLVDVRVKRIDNKRYTMRDIGRLDQRLKNIEYYTALNLLEKSAADLSIKDADGLDKFKNGFISDNFTKFQAADLDSPEFRAANDPALKELRPSFGMRSRKLQIQPTESFNYTTRAGSVAMLTYNPDVLLDSAMMASKHISINPYHVFNKKGTVILDPNTDQWSDTTRAPDMVITQDMGTQAFSSAAKAMDRLWGQSWRDSNTTIPPREDSYRIADGRLTDVSVVPYVRPNDVKFYAFNMAPNTNVYPFFDKKPVSSYVRPVNGKYGDQLTTDSEGVVEGVFSIPPGIFFTGSKQFKLTGSPRNSADPEASITMASNTYWAGGIDSTSQDITLNVITPSLNSYDTNGLAAPIATSNSYERVITDDADKPNFTAGEFEVSDQMQKVITSSTGASGGVGVSEPIAQSFYPLYECFITKVVLYFAQVDKSSKDIWVEIRTMDNGVPTATVLGRSILDVDKIITSDDSTLGTVIEFDVPVYVEREKFYAFVVGGSSPDTRIWVARMGQPLAYDPTNVVDSQMSYGSSFRSSNGSSWLAEQFEDVKYQIYRAQFDSEGMNLVFNIMPEYEQLQANPFNMTAGSNVVKVSMRDHAASIGDKVRFKISEGITLSLNGIHPAIDDIIESATGVAKIATIGQSSGEELNISTEYTLKEVYGSFEAGQVVTIRDTDSSGVVVEGTPTELNGIPLVEFIEVPVVSAISRDIFAIEFTTPASADGKFGGSGVMIDCPFAYETINLSASYMKYGSSDKWDLIGVASNKYNHPRMLPDYGRVTPQTIPIGSDVELSAPMKIAGMAPNVSGEDRLTTIQAHISAPWSTVSPVVNLGTLSAVLVSNRVSFETADMAGDSFVPETDGSGGIESYKYVSRVVNLAMPAADMMFILDVERDGLSTVDLYYRSTGAAGGDISVKEWTQLPFITNVSTTKVEYTLNLVEALGSILDEEDLISSFQVKIVGRTPNPARPPKFANLRIIAVT